MGRSACNGWKFWSVGTEGTKRRHQGGAARSGRPGPSGGEGEQGRARHQAGARPAGHASGETRSFCSACTGSFYADADPVPDFCPKGHPSELDANGDLVTQPPVIDQAPTG